MTNNPNRIPFKDMPREDQDRVAGAIARGERVERWCEMKFMPSRWVGSNDDAVSVDAIYRIQPAEDRGTIDDAFMMGEKSKSYSDFISGNGDWYELCALSETHTTKPETSVVNITFENVNITPYPEDRDFVTYGGEYSNVGDMIKRHIDAVTPKPAKDPNRPRPAHKLNLRYGDVVRHVGWQGEPSFADGAEITVGEDGVNGSWLDLSVNRPLPKGQRPLFVVVSRANVSS